MTGSWGENSWGAQKSWNDNATAWGARGTNDWAGNGAAEVVVEDPIAEKTKQVTQHFATIGELKKWTPKYIALLENGLQNAIQEPNYRRTAVQKSVVADIRDGFKAFRESLEMKVQRAKEHYEGSDEFVATATERKETLLVKLEEVKIQKEEAILEVEKAHEALETVKTAHGMASSGIEEAHEKLKNLKITIVRADNVYEKEFLPIKEDHRARTRMEKITAMMEKLGGAEAVLINSIDVSLRTAERGEVANHVIAMADVFFTERIAGLKLEKEKLEADGIIEAEQNERDAEEAVRKHADLVTDAENVLANLDKEIEDLHADVARCERSVDDPMAFKEELKDLLESAEEEVENLCDAAEDGLDFLERQGYN